MIVFFIVIVAIWLGLLGWNIRKFMKTGMDFVESLKYSLYKMF